MQRKDNADALTQSRTCFGSASGFSEWTNHSPRLDTRLKHFEGAREALAQGRNGSVNPLALRQRGTITEP